MTTKSILGRRSIPNGSGAYRHGPTNGSGEARLEKTGSVRNVAPPTETRNDAWPIHVTAQYHVRQNSRRSAMPCTLAFCFFWQRTYASRRIRILNGRPIGLPDWEQPQELCLAREPGLLRAGKPHEVGHCRQLACAKQFLMVDPRIFKPVAVMVFTLRCALGIAIPRRPSCVQRTPRHEICRRPTEGRDRHSLVDLDIETTGVHASRSRSWQWRRAVCPHFVAIFSFGGKSTRNPK